MKFYGHACRGQGLRGTALGWTLWAGQEGRGAHPPGEWAAPHVSAGLRQLWGTPGRQGVLPGHPAWAVCRLEVRLCLGFSACRQPCLICDLGPAVV